MGHTQFTPEQKEQFSTRAKELLAQGKSQQYIADDLGISLASARRYALSKKVTITKKTERKKYTRKPKLVQIESAPVSGNQEIKLKVVYELLRFLNEK